MEEYEVFQILRAESLRGWKVKCYTPFPDEVSTEFDLNKTGRLLVEWSAPMFRRKRVPAKKLSIGTPTFAELFFRV